MKQRLGLASTLLGDPGLIVLDEPTNGLDPAGQQEVRALIPRLADAGRAVVITSHLLHDIEQVCDRVAILQDGRLKMAGSLTDLLGGDGYIELRIGDTRAALEVLQRVHGCDAVTLADGAIRVRAAPGSSATISRVLAGAGLYVDSMIEKQESLEDLFFDVTGRREVASNDALACQ
jgi:ABC-2 type transport system ATP-binding protein